ncbi:MAG: hypothetical protein Q9224_006455, partial [Gallowayella concinna]
MDRLLQDTVGAIQQERAQHRDCLLKAHHQNKTMEQELETRSLNLLGESQKLRAEQDKSARLQDSLTRLNEEILVKLADRDAIMASKIEVLGKSISDSVNHALSTGQEDLGPGLQECLVLLKEPLAKHTVGANDIHKLDNSIKVNADGIAHLASLCQDSINATSCLESRLTSEFSARVEELVSSVEARRSVDQQLKDLQNTSASISEKLRATEASLAESRNRVFAAETQEKVQLHKAASLEAEVNVLRNRPQESSLMALRLHDSEKQCARMNEQLSSYQLQLEDAKDYLKAKSEEYTILQSSLETVKAELVEVQAKYDVISLEKIALEGQAVLNEERVRAEFSAICKNEISRNNNKALNQIHALQTAKSTADEKARSAEASVSELTQLLTTSRSKESKSELDAGVIRREQVEKDLRIQDLETDLEKLRKGRAQESQTTQELRSQLSKAKADKTELNSRTKTSERLLASAMQDLKAQDTRIKELLNERTTIVPPKTALGGSLVQPNNLKPLPQKKAVGFSRPALDQEPINPRKDIRVV